MKYRRKPKMPKSPLAAGLLLVSVAAGWVLQHQGASVVAESVAAGKGTASHVSQPLADENAVGIPQCSRYDSGEVVRNRARPVRVAGPGEVTVATQNLWRLFNDRKDGRETTVADAKEYRGRLAKVSLYVRDVMRSPDILAVQEVENLAVLGEVADRIAQDGGPRYSAWLEEGHDIGGIDSGFLVSPRVEVKSVTPLMADMRFERDNSFLFDRPPLWLQARVNGRELHAVAVHLRSMLGSKQGNKAERVREKRFAQAYELSRWIAAFQKKNPSAGLVILGDFNAYVGGDGDVDVIGQIMGVSNDKPLRPVQDVVNPDLLNQLRRVPENERYSYVHDCHAQAIDHLLTNTVLDKWVKEVAFTRGNADATGKMAKKYGSPERTSDHDGLVMYLQVR